MVSHTNENRKSLVVIQFSAVNVVGPSVAAISIVIVRPKQEVGESAWFLVETRGKRAMADVNKKT